MNFRNKRNLNQRQHKDTFLLLTVSGVVSTTVCVKVIATEKSITMSVTILSIGSH